MNMLFVFLSLIFLIYVLNVEKKGSISVRESFLWFFGSLLSLLLSIFPKTIDYVANSLGIFYPPSLLFLISIVFLLFINFRNSKKISEQNEKITELAQQLSILKYEVDRSNKTSSNQ